MTTKLINVTTKQNGIFNFISLENAFKDILPPNTS